MAIRLPYREVKISRISLSRLEREILTLKEWGRRERRKNRIKRRIEKEKKEELELLTEAEKEILAYYERKET
jgi:hypothetical protein